MKIGVGLKNNAYTPEAYAYEKFLKKNDFQVQLEKENKLDANNDINIYFMGIDPFWKEKKGHAKIIHEYQSLSTPPWAVIRNLLKSNINKTPNGRIFLNKDVMNGFDFYNSAPFIFRDMGVDDEMFQESDEIYEYDIVYCGSIKGRPFLIKEVTYLSNLGFSILMIGDIDIDSLKLLSRYKNIECTGRVGRDALPNMYKKCRFGLNYTPNIYPFNIQTSTKTLEYIASGLCVISNKYQWSELFSTTNCIDFIWLDSISSYSDVKNIKKSKAPDFIKNYSWSNVLNQSKLIDFLITI